VLGGERLRQVRQDTDEIFVTNGGTFVPIGRRNCHKTGL